MGHGATQSPGSIGVATSALSAASPSPGFFLYYPSRQQLSPKLEALVDFFKLAPKKPRR